MADAMSAFRLTQLQTSAQDCVLGDVGCADLVLMILNVSRNRVADPVGSLSPLGRGVG